MERKTEKSRRNNFSALEKVAILKRHLIEKIPISDLCDQYSIQASQFYSWQKTFFENGSYAFESDKKSKNSADARKMQELANKLRRKDEVLSELMEEHMTLKKTLGEI